MIDIGKKIALKIHWFLTAQMGLDFLRLYRSCRGLAPYIFSYYKFKKNNSQKIVLTPCLNDRYEEGGATNNEYFWQDLLVARMIHEKRPLRHMDVGSRVDGFVAHVASFREIEVLDIRPISAHIPGIIFTQQDLMADINIDNQCKETSVDSLSCLHALEHFGLGRYGDTIDARGYEKGLSNMAKILSEGGTLYLSTPIGFERVEFNANRVFDPRTLISLSLEYGLELQTLTTVAGNGSTEEVEINSNTLQRLAEQHYCLGIFVFKKTSNRSS